MTDSKTARELRGLEIKTMRSKLNSQDAEEETGSEKSRTLVRKIIDEGLDSEEQRKGAKQDDGKRFTDHSQQDEKNVGQLDIQSKK